MTKKLLPLVLLLIAVVCNVFAQQIEIENVSANGMPGMKASDDGNLFYTYYFEEVSVNEKEPFVIVLYNHDFMEMKRVPVEISRTNTLVASAFTGEVFGFIFVDANKKTRTVLAVDRNGNTLKKLEEENVPAALLKAENYIVLKPLMPDFVMVRTTAKNEFVVERLDMRLEPGVSNKFDLDGNKWQIENVQVLNDVLFMLLKDGEVNKAKYELRAIRLGDGKQLYKTIVGEGGHMGQATAMHVNDDMSVSTSGLYFVDGNLDNSSAGIFTMSVDLKGTPVFFKKGWDEMKMRSGSKIINSIAEGTHDILIQDMIPQPENRNLYIGELFEKANGGGGTSNFTVSDFVLINTAMGSDSTGIVTIPKPVKTSVVRGPGAVGSKYALAATLHDKHYFPFRMATRLPEKSKLMYRYDNDGNIKLSFIITPDSTNRKIPDVDIDGTDDNTAVAEKPGKGKKAKDGSTGKNIVYNSEIDLATFEDPEISNPIYLLKESRILVSKYNSKDKKIKASVLQVPAE